MERLRSMWFYYLVGFLFRNFLRVFYGLRVEGRENVPLEGPAVIAGNHISWYDPPLIGSTLPREVHYMGKKELFKKQPLKWVVEMLKSFPIDRNTNDTGAIKAALRKLESGLAVGIFPEGTRNAGMEQAFHGASFLAQRAGAPIVPAAIWREGRRFCVSYGKPIYPRGKSREEMVRLTETLMVQVRELIPSTASKRERRLPQEA